MSIPHALVREEDNLQLDREHNRKEAKGLQSMTKVQGRRVLRNDQM